MRRAIVALLLMVAALRVTAEEPRGFSKGTRYDERTGEALYRSICQGCHMPDGQGAKGAGVYPALAKDARLASAGYALQVVIDGRRNMPSFATTLDDDQVAAVVNYVRSHFGNDYGDVVTIEQVAQRRAADRR